MITLSLFCAELLLAQANCSSPLHVELCPGTCIPNQTNAGMVDDASPACNIPGEEVVYEIIATNGWQ